MSSSIFRQITAVGGNGDERAERLFQAAVSAFCSLPRPSRNDLGQLDDLALPLFERVSIAGRRFASAALSECSSAPPGLLKRLSESGVEVAAPLLIRSTALSNADLVSLIARFGLPYAKAVARRRDLHPAIAALVRAMIKPDLATSGGSAAPLPDQQPLSPPLPVPESGHVRGEASAEQVRGKLRAMMRPAGAARTLGGRTAFLRLRDAAIGRRPAFLHTVLADSLAIPFDRAASMTSDPAALALALRALGLKEEEAFLLLALILPHAFKGPEEGFRFLDHYASLDATTAEAAVERWRAEPFQPFQVGGQHAGAISA